MAIVLSTYLSRIVNSVGNMTFQTINKRIIMRQKPAKRVIVPSPGQLASWNRFSACSESFNVLIDWFSCAKYLENKRSNLRNKWTRLTFDYFGSSGYGDDWEAASALAGYSFGSSGWCSISLTDFTGAMPVCVLQFANGSWDSSFRIRYVTFNSVSHEYYLHDEAVSESDWNLRRITLLDSGTLLEVFGIYLYSLRTYKCSNICFVYKTI